MVPRHEILEYHVPGMTDGYATENILQMILLSAVQEDLVITKNEQIEKLIDGLSKGNMYALDKLYELIKTDVYAFALSRTGNQHDAEDITQDTFVQIYRYAKTYKPQGKPLAWIFTITSNLANRRFQLNQRVVLMDERDTEVPDETRFENNVVDNEFLAQIMSTLSREEQSIIVMHAISGLKHAEIAKILGKPLSTVLSKYNRAIKKLQNQVED